MASCAEYRVVGNVFGVHKSTVHKYFHRVVNAIIQVKEDYIKFPKIDEALLIASEFEEKSHIPNIIGAVDGKIHILKNCNVLKVLKYFRYPYSNYVTERRIFGLY